MRTIGFLLEYLIEINNELEKQKDAMNHFRFIIACMLSTLFATNAPIFAHADTEESNIAIDTLKNLISDENFWKREFGYLLAGHAGGILYNEYTGKENNDTTKAILLTCAFMFWVEYMLDLGATLDAQDETTKDSTDLSTTELDQNRTCNPKRLEIARSVLNKVLAKKSFLVKQALFASLGIASDILASKITNEPVASAAVIGCLITCTGGLIVQYLFELHKEMEAQP